MPWLKLLHIAALVIWCGSLLYLPALLSQTLQLRKDSGFAQPARCRLCRPAIRPLHPPFIALDRVGGLWGKLPSVREGDWVRSCVWRRKQVAETTREQVSLVPFHALEKAGDWGRGPGYRQERRLIGHTLVPDGLDRALEA